MRVDLWKGCLCVCANGNCSLLSADFSVETLLSADFSVET